MTPASWFILHLQLHLSAEPRRQLWDLIGSTHLYGSAAVIFDLSEAQVPRAHNVLRRAYAAGTSPGAALADTGARQRRSQG